MRRALIAGLLLTAGAPLAGQVRDPLDSIVNAQMAERRIPGVAVAVLRGGRPVAIRAWGTVDIANGTAADTATSFGIASVSKQFLAAGVLLLVQEGKVTLDDEIGRHLPETANAWKGITLRQLLSHTGGIQRESQAFNGALVQPDSVVVVAALSQPFDHTPGTRYQYCNVCYFAIAEMIRRVSGTPWEEFFQARIFRPLNMRATATTNVAMPRRAQSYFVTPAGTRVAAEYAALRPSGAFVASIADLARWETALWTDRPLSASSRAEMTTAVPLRGGTVAPYGLGWAIDTLAGRSIVQHGGSLAGFRSHYLRIPGDSLAVIVLTNADVGRPAVIAAAVARSYLQTR
jgi:D-alanyl-D-alanine carboxypeptidase